MPWTYRPALDGLRSIAVYLVLLFHAGLALVGGGFIGVDLFFVLSGFLVSNVILSELDQTGRLNLGRFYARRIRRLLPAAVLVIVATSGMFLLVASVVRRLPLVLDAQSALLYAANWNFLLRKNDYFATNVDESPFLHFWSLSIEEQFYFVFPIVLLLLVRAARKRSWLLPAGVGVLFALSLGSQLYWAQTDANWAYYGTDARLYQLLAGILLTLLLRGTTRRPSARTSGLVAAAGLGGLLVLGSGLLDLSPSLRGIGATAASVVLVGGLMVGETGMLARLLSHRTPVYLGQISYGTYLWHWPVILLIEEFLAVRPAVVAVLAMVLSTALAALSFQLLEMPVRSAAALRRFRWSTVVVGVGASALVAATVVPVVLESERRPQLALAAAAPAPAADAAEPGLQSTAPAKLRNAPIPQDIDWDAVLGEGMPKPKCTTADPLNCVVVEGSGPHLTLVGDSHAGMLAPMLTELAEEHDLTLSFNIVPACPWQAGVINKRTAQSSSEGCRAQRDTWYDEVLPKMDTDLVILAARSRDDAERWDGRLVRSDRSGREESVSEVLLDTTLDTVSTITSKGPRVLLVDSMPTTDKDPLECLATASKMYECEVVLPTKAPASDSYNRIAAERSDKVFTVNLNEVFCVGAPRCLPVVDGVVVWRDPAHISIPFTLARKDEIWDEITSSGALEGL